MHRVSRRTFLATSFAAAGASAISRRAHAAPLPALTGSTRLEQFDYGDVRLLDGPMLEQFRANHAYFLALNDDSLLQPFRQKAGLPAPGEPMGGWYSWSKEFDPPKNMTGYVPGHTFGQYMSGLARAFAATGDDATRQKISRLVRGYAEAITPKFYEGYPLPAYTSDKTACGLIDAHRFAHDPQALAVLAHATDAVLPFLPEKALNRQEMAARPHPNISYTWDESYTLPENFFLAYQISGDPRYLALAKRFLQDDTYFNPLAEGRECSARPACLQSRQCAQFRVSGVPGSGQREAFARGAQRLRFCRGHADHSRPADGVRTKPSARRAAARWARASTTRTPALRRRADRTATSRSRAT